MAYELTAEQKKIAEKAYFAAKASPLQGIYDATAAVLESATEPGGELSDAEWEALYQEYSRRNINAILAQRRVLKDADRRFKHNYLSTACFHGLHDRCRQECKFCATKCSCTCGHPAPASDPAPAQTKGDGETAHRMAQAYMNIPIGRRDERWIAVLQVAREGYWSAEAVEEIVRSTAFLTSHGINDIIASLQRLSAPATKTRIRTSFVNPPIPVRHFDWVAWIDGDEENGFHGHGRNESEAINELMNLQAQFDESDRAELAQLRKEQP